MHSRASRCHVALLYRGTFLFANDIIDGQTGLDGFSIGRCTCQLALHVIVQPNYYRVAQKRGHPISLQIF